MFIEHALNLIGGIGLIHAGGDQQLTNLDGIEVKLVRYRLEGRIVGGTVESHSCVHLILKDSAWVIVRLGWFTAATGLSLFRHHIASFVLIFVIIYIFHTLTFFSFSLFISVTNYIHAPTESRVCDIF